jgi:Ca-activated chloride channel family protein
VDIVVAVDVSRSMLAEDVEPNRLGRAKRDVRQQLIDRALFTGVAAPLRRGNRLSLLAFAGSTSLRLPLTTDRLAFGEKLDHLQVGVAPRGGTAIAPAIRAATDLFATSPEDRTKIILLLTDGEDHDRGGFHAMGGPVEAARQVFEEQRIRTFTVAVGDPAPTVGAQIPIDEDGQRKPLLHNGQIVFSKLDVAGLRQIAEAGGGDYASIDRFRELVNTMAQMRKTELTTEEKMRHKPRYQWFLAVALILLGLETMIGERRATSGDAPLQGSGLRRVSRLEVTR